MACVYKHIRLDTGNVFYIGIGNKTRRAYDLIRRGKHWKGIYKNTEISIEIVFDKISYEEAKSWEKYLIGLYGRKDLNTGHLCNKTEGGDGTLGLVVSKETRIKHSLSSKNRRHSEETKAKMSLIQSNRSDETRRKIAESKRGKKRSKQTIMKMSISKIGKRVNAKKVIDLSTGFIYSCAIDAAEVLCVKPGTLRSWLRGENMNKTSLRYL